MRAAPELHRAESAGGQQISLAIEGERANEIFVRGAGPTARGQRRIDQFGNHSRTAQIVNRQFVAAAAGDKLVVGRDRQCEDRVRGRGKRLAMHNTGNRSGGALCSLIDPGFEQTELLRRKRRGRHLVVHRRHHRIVLVGGQLQEPALAALAGHNVRPVIAPFANRLGRFEDQAILGIGRLVAGQTVLGQQRQDLPSGNRPVACAAIRRSESFAALRRSVGLRVSSAVWLDGSPPSEIARDLRRPAPRSRQ